jgi:hypothetical protein|tara:strand:- start:3188 stop:3376 length:189 start_codon:yes stop_codon:yes gene_type:complete
MIIFVTYNKTTGAIEASSDISIIPVEVNPDSIVDTLDALNFKIAVNTTAYEAVNSPVENPID